MYYNQLRTGMPRPIDLQAHEPRRYVGDMAAWIHQAVASEDELINTLLGTIASLSTFHFKIIQFCC